MKNIPGRWQIQGKVQLFVAYVNALGNEVPPLVVVKGKTQASLSAFSVAETPAETKFTYQTKRWMEDILGIEWFESHFLQQCGVRRPQLLILDSHSSMKCCRLSRLPKRIAYISLHYPNTPHSG